MKQWSPSKDAHQWSNDPLQRMLINETMIPYLCHLQNKLTGLHHHVYFDNYYTSISLLLNLLKTGLFGCGTIRTNRKRSLNDLLAIANKAFTVRGQSKTWQYENLTVTVWQDTRPVVIAPTNSDPTTSTSFTRKQWDGTQANVQALVLVTL